MIELFDRGGIPEAVLVRRLPADPGLPAPDRPVPSSGELDLDGFVSETITLDDVEEAFRRMQHGEVLRSVVLL